MSTPIRVLVVDDSAFARKVMREVLLRAPGFEVVGVARDGLEALEKIAQLKPDVVTLDLVMPNLDGVGVLQALRGLPTAPAVVLVSISGSDTELAVTALELGAVDVVQKPTAHATDQLYELGGELAVKVRAAGQASPRLSRELVVEPTRSFAGSPTRKLVVIGTSTGGPAALSRLIAAFPSNLPLPVVVALHIPAGYTEALAKRLDANSPVDVVEASDEVELRPGLVVLAQGGSHIEVARDGERTVARTVKRPVEAAHAPSVDLLFESAAKTFGSGVVGVVLTGMGDDGCRGARAIHEAGGVILTESAASCVVYGMPRCVREAGLSSSEVPLESMSAELQEFLRLRPGGDSAQPAPI